MDNEKKIALQFAEFILDREVTKVTNEDVEMKKVSYRPPEYDLLRGELNKNGDELFDNFLETRKQYILDYLYQQHYNKLEEIFTENFMNNE